MDQLKIVVVQMKARGLFLISILSVCMASYSAEQPQAAPLKTLEHRDQMGNEVGTHRHVNRVKLVFVGDGFMEADKGKFYQAAQEKYNYLMGYGSHEGVSPFKYYKEYFVGYALFVPSDSAPIPTRAQRPFEDSVPLSNLKRIFGSHFGGWGSERAIKVPEANKRTLREYLMQEIPDYDSVTLIVNSQKYGGTGGFPLKITLDYQSNETMAHELAHGFGNLGDEYSTPYPGFPDIEEPNTTKEPSVRSSKWSHWVDLATAFSSENKEKYFSNAGHDNLITHSQGAHYHTHGWYRPSRDCKMKVLGQEFCHVCQERLIEAIYERANAIDEVSPSDFEATQVLSKNQPLSIKLVQPKKQDQIIKWYFSESATGERREIVEKRGALKFTLSDYQALGISDTKFSIDVEVEDTSPILSSFSREGMVPGYVTWYSVQVAGGANTDSSQPHADDNEDSGDLDGVQAKMYCGWLSKETVQESENFNIRIADGKFDALLLSGTNSTLEHRILIDDALRIKRSDNGHLCGCVTGKLSKKTNALLQTERVVIKDTAKCSSIAIPKYCGWLEPIEGGMMIRDNVFDVKIYIQGSESGMKTSIHKNVLKKINPDYGCGCATGVGQVEKGVFNNNYLTSVYFSQRKSDQSCSSIQMSPLKK